MKAGEGREERDFFFIYVNAIFIAASILRFRKFYESSM